MTQFRTLNPLAQIAGVQGAVSQGQAIRGQRQGNQLQEMLMPMQVQEAQNSLDMQGQKMAESERAEAMQMLGLLGQAIGDDFEGLAPEEQQARYMAGVQAVGQAGFDVSDAPQGMSPDSLRLVRFAQSQMGTPAAQARYGALATGVDAEGNSVYFQPVLGGDGDQFRVLEGMTPPSSASDKKRAQENSLAAGDVKATVDLFTNTLTDPDVGKSLGLEGAVNTFIGRKITGSNAGVLGARLKRNSVGMILNLKDKMPGVLSDSDVALLKSTMPEQTDLPEIWIDWYNNDFIPYMQNKYQSVTGQQLDGLSPISMPQEAAPSAQAGGDDDLDALIQQAENL